ncbi:DUF4833 domain-containing protein [Neptunitalea lumnitzerae]|nr:DUF4833 domain-containing protein [Neptunitalea sp. Y10]
MLKSNHTNTLLFVLLMCIGYGMQAQDNYPTPTYNKNRLFYIQHSKNHNTYVYDAKITNNHIDKNDPIDVYRIVYEGNTGTRKSLTAIQRRLAYGIISDCVNNNLYEMHLAASKDLELYLCLNNEKQPKVYTTINHRKMFIDKLFIELKSGGLHIKADYILFYGTDYNTGEQVTEKLILDN